MSNRFIIVHHVTLGVTLDFRNFGRTIDFAALVSMRTSDRLPYTQVCMVPTDIRIDVKKFLCHVLAVERTFQVSHIRFRVNSGLFYKTFADSLAVKKARNV